ncbi:G-protein coupled receptor 52-like [Lineus longissimus]|uniref:G-protein coupled receptor 52-like n=1 Tax=Lineus longissimus TaxID=88925 RepID=UPI00315DB0E1
MSTSGISTSSAPTCGVYGKYMCNYQPGYAVIIFLVTLFILVGNIFNLLVLTRTRAMHNNPGYYMINLAVTDLGLGIICGIWAVPLSVSGLFQYTEGSMIVHGFFAQLFCAVSICTLGGVSFDRYLAISRPLRYPSIMTGKVCFVIIIVIWIVNVLVMVPPFCGFGSYIYSENTFGSHFDFMADKGLMIYSFSIQIFPGMVVVIFSYVQIFLITRRHIRAINIAGPRGGGKISSNKAMKTLAITVLVFFVCWIPFTVQQMVVASINHHPEIDNTPTDSDNTPRPLDFILTWLAVSNSFMNCIIYSVTNKEYRNGARKILYAMAGKVPPHQHHETSFAPSSTSSTVK